MAKYDAERSKIRTADIVLFSGKGGISHGIKLITNSKWSHVGMALRLPEWDTLLLWESTTLSSLADVIAGKETRGVQLVVMRDRLRTYDGEVTVRHLRGVNVDGKPDLKRRLMKFRKSVRDRPYEKSRLELIKAAYEGPFGRNEEDLSSLFCSELVAEAYQQMGLLPGPPDGPPSNEYTPRDFSAKKHLPLARGISLGKEILLTV
jgi:hypothetical protein